MFYEGLPQINFCHRNFFYVHVYRVASTGCPSVGFAPTIMNKQACFLRNIFHCSSVPAQIPTVLNKPFCCWRIDNNGTVVYIIRSIY
ncbi:hypothetical protein CW304_03125 [Bacillus sp. UFRGS-B20]|nr:hypothetical protein CW304_03125 [Bacillus sp. UFRGS-B20]